MQNKKNKLGRFWAVLVAFVFALAMSTGQVLAQATAESTLTDAADDLTVSGTSVGIAALGIFAALLIFGVAKRFFMAGK